MTPSPDTTAHYRDQHKQRLNYMPWLYWTLKPQHKAWAKAWQEEWQTHLQHMETIKILGECFISPKAHLFAEPGRPIVIDKGASIAADCVLHGPIQIGQNVGINHHCTFDGGRAGITLGNHCRVACYTKMFAFNHGMAPARKIGEQPVTSKGIRIGEDVWIGADVKIVDGVTIGDHCIVGMGSVVTTNLCAGTKAAGNPAKIFGSRR